MGHILDVFFYLDVLNITGIHFIAILVQNLAYKDIYVYQFLNY